MSQIDPFVPSSDQPKNKSEWTGHFWYAMRAFALQASEKFAANGPEVRALVDLFTNLWVGLPCLRCKRDYVENFKTNPYTAVHARSAAQGLLWIQNLRATIQANVDAAARLAVQSETIAHASSALPIPPGTYYPGLQAPGSNHTPAALARQAAAITAALTAKALNEKAGECGCGQNPKIVTVKIE
jgi:hypothetical protein